MSTLEKALVIAAKAHEGQLDKAGENYILHPLRVMARMTTLEARIVAVLHDVVEDSDVTLTTLEAQGFSRVIVSAVDALTKRPGEEYEAYIYRAGADPLSRTVKLADLEDNCNMARIAEPRARDYQRLEKYRRAIEMLTGGEGK